MNKRRFLILMPAIIILGLWFVFPDGMSIAYPQIDVVKTVPEKTDGTLVKKEQDLEYLTKFKGIS